MNDLYTGERKDLWSSLIDSTLTADVSVQGSFENVAVGSREASIVATIVNELAANASKHSFNRSSGTIFLSGEGNKVEGGTLR